MSFYHQCNKIFCKSITFPTKELKKPRHLPVRVFIGRILTNTLRAWYQTVHSARSTTVQEDLFQVGDLHFLVIADYFTKFPVVIEVKNLSSSEISKHFKLICSLFGRPNTIISDNGPQFVGPHFKQFIQDWDIERITSSSRYPKANGFAERMVGTVKDIIKK